ncbi:MAG: hypothetical protein WKG00_13405 [Polyangiaceae bacterium]
MAKKARLLELSPSMALLERVGSKKFEASGKSAPHAAQPMGLCPRRVDSAR